ncbi:MAG: CBS domain-containing protein [Thermomicrobiales bacterium]|nr:CBS domain-containing protein [Thermomicrobiales bacterium]
MDAGPVSVLVDDDQELAAHVMQDHDVVTLPVVDVNGVLVGVISHDDILDVLEQATRDIEQLGGSQPLELPYRRAGVQLLYLRRVWWLLALFLAEAYTGTVLRHYEG